MPGKYPFIVIIPVQYEENRISVFLHVQNSYCVPLVYGTSMKALNKRENRDVTTKKERERERGRKSEGKKRRNDTIDGRTVKVIEQNKETQKLVGRERREIERE